MTAENKAVPPAVRQDGPIYQSITSRAPEMSAARKSPADLGLAKVSFTYLEGVTLRIRTVIVTAETVTAVLGLLADGEIG